MPSVIVQTSVTVAASVCGFDNYYEAKGFCSEVDGLLVERRNNLGLYRYLCEGCDALSEFRFLVLLDLEVA